MQVWLSLKTLRSTGYLIAGLIYGWTLNKKFAKKQIDKKKSVRYFQIEAIIVKYCVSRSNGLSDPSQVTARLCFEYFSDESLFLLHQR